MNHTRIVVVGNILLALLLTVPAAIAQDTLQIHGYGLPNGERLVLKGVLSLSEAVRLSSQNNPEVQLAREDTTIAEAEVQIARSARLPLIGVGAAYTLANDNFFYTLSTGLGNIPRSSAGEFNLGLSLPLFTGGRLEAQEARADAQRDATRFDLSTSRRASLFAVRQAYYQAVLAQTQEQVYRDYVAQREATLSNTRERLAVGKVPRVYVLRDETELATSKQTLLAAQTLKGGAFADLKRAMGVSPASDFTLSDDLQMRTSTADLAQFLSKIDQKNPELAALRLRIQSAQADLHIAQAVFLPQINLYGQGELRTPATDGFGNGGSLVVAATLPILDFGGRGAEVAKAAAGLRKARIQLDAKEQDLSRMVTRAWLDLQQASGVVVLTRAAVTQASEENRLAQERFAVGRSIQVELLDSSVTLLRARLENLKAVYDQNVALAQLEQLTDAEVP
ncbi:MAG: TolC family protein [Anaerolineae bacterium]|nr:TolC family protein [Gloeobacterales cyanobacterium ES-bin-313]